MKSKVVVMGHPLHPMLIPFPFAFLTGAVAFDAAAWLWSVPSWWTTGGALVAVGIATALLAAVPGIVDLLYVVPPKSSGKQRATKHMLANSSAVLLFALAWFMRPDNATPAIGVLAIEVVALALLGAGGWMGGTLVYRNQIAVDHRYANAGKWQEAAFGSGKELVVGKKDDLEVNQMKLVRVGDRRIVLGRSEQGYVAFDDRCTHKGGSLADGVMICGTVQCPWHGSQFDTSSGEVKAGPAKVDIGSYKVTTRKGELVLHL